MHHFAQKTLLTFLRRVCLVFLPLVAIQPATAQSGIIPTMGTEFWVGFMYNPEIYPLSMQIFISSEQSTTGTVTAPLLGINMPFTVIANVTTTITLSSASVMHTSSDVVDNKGILVTTADTVAVFAINFESYTADAQVIYPIKSLGTEYRVFSYSGIVGMDSDYASEFLIVSPQDGTEVQITTTGTTMGGHVANTPWIVQLDSGETYQVRAANGSVDLTGSTIVGTEASGSCRPFAVFSGVSCANIPTGCTACDHICEQNLPTKVWGSTYYSVPFSTTTGYTYRLMSHLNGTQVSVDGGPVVNLDAGDFVSVNNTTTAHAFVGNQPFSAAQYMQGVTCSGNGDPALLILNAVEQKINNVTFATVVSTVITDHYLNVVIASTSIGTLILDGTLVPVSSFTAFTGDPTMSYARLAITQGSHTLNSPAGFSAYVYGMGSAESYAYSVGSYSSEPPLPVDSVLCGLDSTGSITLVSPSLIFNPYWTLYSAPDDTLHEGSSYTFMPPGSDIYSVTGSEFISGCSSQYLFSVEISDPPILTVTADGEATTSSCAYEPVQLNVIPAPGGTYLYTWWPAATLNDANIPDPIATPAVTTWYFASVSSLSGCAVGVDSILVTVAAGDVLMNEASPESTMLCLGDSVQFQMDTRQVVGEDLLNGSIGALWQAVTGATLSNICGAVDGDALYFNGAPPRAARTVGLSVPNGGTVRFGLKVANGTAPCDDAEVGDNIKLQYSLTGLAPWVDIATYLEYNYPEITMVEAEIPAAAFSVNTFFRWTQIGTVAAGQDNWVLDQVTIAAVDESGLSFAWTPSPTLSSSTISDPWAYPTVTGWYTVTTTDAGTSCVYTDSVHVDVGEPFSIAITPDTSLCDVAGIQLTADPSSGTGHTWTWTNGATLNADFVQSPLATPTSTTTYGVTVTTAQGCVATGDVTITVGQLHDLNVTVNDASICAGEVVQLHGVVSGSSAGLVHSWTPSISVASPNAALTNATPMITSMFIDLVTDTASGCALSDSVLVTVVSLYDATASNDTLVCTGPGLGLSVVHNVPAPATYSWTPANLLTDENTANPVVQFDSTMAYIVQVSDAAGCSAYDTVNVTVAFSSIQIMEDTAFCIGGSAVIDAGFPLATHTWNTGETTQTIVADTSGVYTVTMTDSTGCERVHSTTVLVRPLPVVDIGPDPGLCVGESQTLDAGNPASAHVWNTTDQTQSITVSENGTYSVEVTDLFGCVNSDTVSLTFYPLPVIDLHDTTVCISEVITYDAENEGSTYLWDTGDTTRTIDVTTTSTTVNVVVTTAENCADSAHASVVFIPFPVVDLGPDTALCDEETITLDATTPGVSYQWNTGSTAPTATFIDDVIAWVSLYNGYCTTYDSVNIVFNPLPNRDLAPFAEACLDEPPHYFSIDANNPDCSFLWNTGATSQVILAVDYQLYSVVITTPLHCTIEESIDVAEYCPSTIFMPNSFTPDDNGVNDLFFPQGNNIASMRLSVFDRWGEMISDGSNGDAIWDGTRNGEKVPDGVYTWRLTYRFYEDSNHSTIGAEVVRVGHVTVLR